MIFEKKNKWPELKLISLHIQKTGGSSLLKALQSIYREETVFWYRSRNFNGLTKEARLDSIVPEETVVLHGHFHYSQVKNIHRRSGAKLVTFLRNPVERIISRYFFTQKELKKNLSHPKNDQRGESLLEFSARKTNQNKMSKYLKGVKIADIDFIGFTDKFDDDLAQLARMMNWPQIPVFHEKDNRAFYEKYPVNEEEKRQIAAYNKVDLALFEKAKNFRKDLIQ